MNKLLYTILLVGFSMLINAQEKKDISEMTKEDVLEMSYDELLEMPFEDVLKLADIVGVSMDELYEMLLNKDVVSASKKVESSFEAPLSTSVVSYDEIINSGARSIEEALRLVPGLIVREKTNGNFDIHIRGNDNLPPHQMLLYSENSITLVMIDGRPVYNYVHGGTFWETLPVGIDDVDRIEIVRGPSSALYGPNSVSGVVNIITKALENKRLSTNANVQGGTQGTVISSLSVGSKISDKFSIKVTGNFETMNRNTDLLFVHKANGGDGGFITLDELTNLQDPLNPGYLVFDPSDDVHEMFPKPKRSRIRGGGNAFLFYNVNDDLKFNLKTGIQASDILSSTMGDNPMSLVGRISNTGYVDFNAQVAGLRAQVNYLGGNQDIIKQDTGFAIDLVNFNSNIEYDFHFGNLNIRPGFVYQKSQYNDLPYLRFIGQGFLNGKREFNSTALSLRADYLAFDKLRLIGAVRAEKYDTHDDFYLSYQLIASYNLNDMHNFRLVHSRANRGPFLVDSYANYFWEREGRPIPGFIYFQGTENLDLLTMDMFEFGYRVKPSKKIQADFELFMNKSENYGSLYPDSASVLGYGTSPRPYVRMSYSNIDLLATQYGASANISWVVNKDLILKLFGTVQTTNLKNVIPDTPEGAITFLLLNASSDTIGPDAGTSTYSNPAREEHKNTATPSVYGGFVLNYSVKDKFNLNSTAYYYSGQEFSSKYGMEIMDSKVILNMKVSYNPFENVTVFVNVRNILSKQIEFAYMDEIGPVLMAGLTFKY